MAFIFAEIGVFALFIVAVETARELREYDRQAQAAQAEQDRRVLEAAGF